MRALFNSLCAIQLERKTHTSRLETEDHRRVYVYILNWMLAETGANRISAASAAAATAFYRQGQSFSYMYTV